MPPAPSDLLGPPSPLDLLTALARRYAFADLGALAPMVLPEAVHISAVCEFGQRLLTLDAEDFATEVDRAVPAALRRRARECHMPQTSREQPRGALSSLRPAFGLLLEVIRVRWERRELSSVMSALHIAGEYLPLLAFEPVLGHAGDPVRWPEGLRAPGSRFGVIGDRECDHTKPEKSAAERTLRVAHEPGEGWRAYFDRQHSQVSGALATCVAKCRKPCTAMSWVPADARDDLAGRAKIALAFADTPLVRLRHAAPVGHGFGVPSPEEVLDAWARSRAHLDKNEVGHQALREDGFPLPGLPSLFSAVAAAPIVPATLLADVAAHLMALLAEARRPGAAPSAGRAGERRPLRAVRAPRRG
ncbi:hypothetical protein Sme01_66540 [Sphaerisporangium melleum]|uniref:Uncharacterized protein n=1 Tax=Sphaerisporangium melleum TaxID=321316 RepID=A0A917VR80_9ACTN|nr:hypothetical protein [Sphaerisporangium melleum]GGL06347.1 hypothetical protein GCM10007964_55770 [Sphaerisporangium melleum]GII74178.1 hypothetical protein Sme01_66540 [Sphaerisporangium melleum]